MTREEFARKINWPRIFFIIGVINVAAQLPQTYTLISEKITDGLSVWMIAIYLSTQLGLGLQGYFKRDTTLMITMELSALVSVVNISLYCYYR